MTQEDKKYISNIIRKETCCGLHDSLIYFEELLEGIKRRPRTYGKTLKIKITWE